MRSDVRFCDDELLVGYFLALPRATSPNCWGWWFPMVDQLVPQ